MPIVDLDAFLERAHSKNSPFDFLIIGGGTAGLVIAHRLALNAHFTVGIIEAGAYHDPGSVPIIDTPGLFPRLQNNPLYDWAFETEPQVNANHRSLALSRGKGLGGSSLINYLCYTRPSKDEYDALETTFNNPGWNWDELLKCMNKSGRFQEQKNDLSGRDPSHVHESRGPIQLTLPPSWPSADLEAGVETLNLNELTFRTMDTLGVPGNPNPTDGNNIGYARPPLCMDPESSMRSSSVRGYLEPILESCPNLLVLTDASVTHILFDRSDPIRKPRAIGVEFRVLGHENTIKIQNVRHEVILSAGSIKTPHILETSGIGDPNILRQSGINCITELPGVGNNFQDHPAVSIVFEVDPKYPTSELLSDPVEFEKHQKLYTEKQEGILAGGLAFAFTFLPLNRISDITKTPSDSILDKIQTETDKYIETSNFPKEVRQGYDKQCKLQMKWLKDPNQAQIEIICSAGLIGPLGNSENANKKRHLTLVASLMHPFSRGTIHHNTTIPNSSNTFPQNNPNLQINPRIISHPIDHILLTKGLECILRLTQTEPLKSAIKGYALPSELSSIDLDKVFKAAEEDKDDESKTRLEEILDSYIRNTVRTIHHPIGTAAMMPREDGGVVDEQLRVYGVDGLRVADLSILPFEISSHTVSTAYAIGEMASDILIKAHGKPLMKNNQMIYGHL